MKKRLTRVLSFVLALVTVLSLLGPMGAEAATMKQGSSGTEVKYLQQNLVGLGFLDGAADGKFGSKTTTAINLGAALVETGRKVLLVDFDPQGSLSVGLGVNPHTLDRSIYNLLLSRQYEPMDVVTESSVDNLDILPSNIDLSAAEVQLVSEVAREQTLMRVLNKLRPHYDYILIDCAPSLGLLTINALTASDYVIMPLECEFFALRGIALLTDTISKVQDRLNPDLEVMGILGTMYDARTLHSREVLERVVQAFGDDVFHTVIRRTIKFPETTVAGEPITTYASASPGADAYRQLAREVLMRSEEE